MDMEKISVIIPVYNSEKYINKCVESLINQSYKNLDIVLIDDGSTDSSGKICDEYAKQDLRIQVFHQKNGGPSKARNYGLKKAQGEYITFVDSDDWLVENAIEKCYEVIKTEDSDILIFNLDFKHKEDDDKKIFGSKKRNMSQDEILNHLLAPAKYNNKCLLALTGSVCKIYKKSIIGDKIFPENIDYAEDMCFFYSLIWRAKKISYIPDILYMYVERKDSLSHNKRKDFPERIIKFVNYILENSPDRVKKELIYEFIFSYYCDIVCYALEVNDKSIIKKYNDSVITECNYDKIDFRCNNRNLQIIRTLVVRKWYFLLKIALKIVNRRRDKRYEG